MPLRLSRWLLPLLLCGACAQSAAMPGAPRTSARARLEPPTARCVSSKSASSTIACVFAGGATLRFDAVRSHAVRAHGGVFVVDAEGNLLRFDRHGRPTGAWPVGAHSVAATGRILCVGTVDGTLACGLDRFDPAGCEAPEPPDLVVLGDPAGGPLHLSREGELVCTVSPGGARECLRVRAVCEQHCLRYPACGGALRCIDPCSDPEALPVVAERASVDLDDRLTSLRAPPRSPEATPR